MGGANSVFRCEYVKTHFSIAGTNIQTQGRARILSNFLNQRCPLNREKKRGESGVLFHVGSSRSVTCGLMKYHLKARGSCLEKKG